LFDRAGGVIADEILSDHHVARLCYRKVRLSRDDQTKALQISCRQQVGMVARQQNFAKIGGTTFRRDGP